MKLIQGSSLNPSLREQVLQQFIHRWTVENSKQTYSGECPACVQVEPFPYICGQDLPDGPVTHTRESWHAYHAPLETDAVWLSKHAFYVNRNGMLASEDFCEPAYMADLT